MKRIPGPCVVNSQSGRRTHGWTKVQTRQNSWDMFASVDTFTTIMISELSIDV